MCKKQVGIFITSLMLPCGHSYDPPATQSTSLPHSWSYWQRPKERPRRSSPCLGQRSAGRGLPQSLAATSCPQLGRSWGPRPAPETDSWLQTQQRGGSGTHSVYCPLMSTFPYWQWLVKRVWHTVVPTCFPFSCGGTVSFMQKKNKMSLQHGDRLDCNFIIF